ncbi:hypothetical protein BSKO_00976 [Bryopsis sp. KO-2023]|nr:hypothetical protein BSKO_00976 [Bryopsis sp. KO-2023]
MALLHKFPKVFRRERWRYNMAPAPKLVQLVKAPLDFETECSPGALHGCRVALQDAESAEAAGGAFVANANRIYGVKIPSLPKLAAVEGRKGVYMPTRVEVDMIEFENYSFRSEVQSIDISESSDGSVLVGGVDSYGYASIGRVAKDWHSRSLEQPTTISQPPRSIREAGWAGIRFDPTDPSNFAISTSMARETVLYGDNRIARVFALGQPPMDLAFNPEDGKTMIVANGNEVWVLDSRVGESGGCVGRILASHIGSQIFCVRWSGSSDVVGVGGSERNLTLWEPRKWRQLCRWSNCLKEAITGLEFSEVAPGHCYVSGMDPACVCGVWDRPPSGKGKRKQSVLEEGSDVQSHRGSAPSFKGDSRWLGVAGCRGGDRLAGLASSGNLFLASFEASRG